MIRLVIDSTCDIPKLLIEKYGIAVLPLQVIIEEKSYQDGCDVKTEQLYEVMRRGIVPKTSQINIAEAEELFRGKLMAEMIAQGQHLFTLDNLNWLVKDGRLHHSAGNIGDKLQIKPILNIVDKTVHIMRIIRGRKAAIRTTVQTFLEKAKDFPAQLIGIQHADDYDTAKQVEQMISEVNPKAKALILPIGCVLASHVGIGGVGLFFFKGPVAG